MKKLFVLAVSVAMFMGCTPQAKLITSSTHTKIGAAEPVAAVFADLDVAPAKISHLYIPTKTVRQGGYDNIVNSAVSEALASNGGADVLVALETQVKYNTKGEVESIAVSGYPAKYVNFRSPGDEYLREASKAQAASSSAPSFLGGLKLKK